MEDVDRLAEDAKRAREKGISYGKLKALELEQKVLRKETAIKKAVQQASADLRSVKKLCRFCARQLPKGNKKFCSLYCQKQYTQINKKDHKKDDCKPERI